jgi:hypothetical protein
VTGDITGPGLTEAPRTALDKALGYVPRALASHAHVLALGVLGLYLVLLPLLSVNVSAKAELIGGNYCNVTSDIGACIAAGGTVALLRHSRRRNRIAEATHRITADLYRFHAGQAHPDAPQSPGGGA